MKRKVQMLVTSVLMALGLAASGGDAGFAFAPVDPTWSIPLQVTTNLTAGVYDPTPVVDSSMSLSIGFGVTNGTSTVRSVPQVSYTVYNASGDVVCAWTNVAGKTLSPNSVAWVSGGDANRVRSLGVGNYMLEAELGSFDRAVFRFAVRETSGRLADAFTGTWSSITAKSGNDFAPPPFAVKTDEAGVMPGAVPGVQFGPFAPMNGIIEYTAGVEKAPLDLIFLIDLTGSMGGCIEGLKGHITAFFKELVEGDGTHPPITNWRAKVVGYRDYFDDDPDLAREHGAWWYGPWFEDHPFTNSVAGLIAQVSSCVATGGGDGPESLLDAVWKISKEETFRREASRVILAFTDIGYKGTGLFDPYPDSPESQYNMGSRWSLTDYQDYLKRVAMEAGEAAAEAEVVVKVITDVYGAMPAGYDDSYYSSGWHFGWLVDWCYSDHSGCSYVSDLSSFTGNADELRNLATSVAETVKEADVVEPALTATASGSGVLSYEWRNLTADRSTNCTFTFRAKEVADSAIPCPSSDSNEWHRSSYDISGSGSHTFQWFYRKLNYDGDILDCGQVRNISWLRVDVPTKVEIIGADEVVCGESADYVAKVTFGNGAVTNIYRGADWTVSPTSPTYSIDADTGKLSTDRYTAADRSVTVGVRYEFDGVAVSDSKTVELRRTLMAPAAPAVKATDGTSPDCVEVTWEKPSSDSPIIGYDVYRGDELVAANVSGTSWTDTSATPGEDYVYAVKAKSEIGTGEAGTNSGWRKVQIAVDPSSLSFGYLPSSQTAAVTSNAPWKIESKSGDHLTATPSGDLVVVAVLENGDLSSRTGTVTIVASEGTDHPARVTLPVSQGKRPGALDYIEIVGGDGSLEGGKESDYRAIAHFDDGTERDVTDEAVWTVKDGKDYGRFSGPGHLVTKETDADKRNITVDATYTGGYGSGTKSAEKDVEVRFTNRLRRPVAVEILGPANVAIDEPATYAALVTYNDGTVVSNGMAGAAGAEWSVRPGMPLAEVRKVSDVVELTAHAFTNLTLSVSCSETVGVKGGGTEVATVSGDKAVSVVRPVDIPVAVDVKSETGAWIFNLPFETGATPNGTTWYGQTAIAHDGVDSARCGYLAGAGESWMETVTTNAGELAFWWNASGAVSGDYLAVAVDGVEQRRIDRASGGWQNVLLTIHAGGHTVRWTYVKTVGTAGGTVLVDQVSWRSATPPGAPGVTASGGDSTDGVDVTWTPPDSERPITGYDVYRGGELVATNVSGTSWTDTSAKPGVDYTYEVRAKSEAGAGDAGTGDGWRKVLIAVDPASLDFGYLPSSNTVAVTSNASWRIKSTGWRETSTDGELKATASGDAIDVVVPKNATLDPRDGTVVVIAGEGTDHPETATLSVSQSKRPAKPTKLEIVDGPTTLEGGSNGTFTVVATFDDGSKRDVTAESAWTVSEGGTYGSFDTPGHLTTKETTDLDGKLKVDVAYSNSDYEPVTLTTGTTVDVTFSMSLLAPVEIWIEGDGELRVTETKPYRAIVAWNNVTTSDVTVAAGTLWSATQPYGTVKKGAGVVELTAHGANKTLTLSAEHSYANAYSNITVVGAKEIEIREIVSLPIALDLEDADISTGGSSGVGNDWYGQLSASHDGVDAAQSGRIFGAGESWMETTVTNAGDVSFWWKTSCEPTYDSLTFAVDGDVKAQASGTTSVWQQLKFEIPGGTHTLRWAYAKDGKNDVGEDSGWVDQLVWNPLPAPSAPSGGDVASIRASDGTSTDYIEVEWDPFDSRRPIYEYELSRAKKDSGDWTVLSTNGVLRYVDMAADPGVDYTYRVRARNDAGWGECVSDDGWRAYAVSVGATEVETGCAAATNDLSVGANAEWEVGAVGAGWLEAAKATETNATLAVEGNDSLDARTNSVTISVGGDSPHATNVTVAVIQAGRPPRMDVGFIKPYEDWRTRLQVTTNLVDNAYAPVSVFTAADPLEIGFGWTNRSEVAVAVPPVRFRLYVPDAAEPVAEWTVEGRAGEVLGPDCGAWSAGWPFEPLKALRPGDYRLEAELAPGMPDLNREGDLDGDENDNIAIFRFAVRNPVLDAFRDVFAEFEFTNVEFKVGNDYAQAPHVAEIGGYGPSIQFGPYVPMNGKIGRSVREKAPLDLIFLIDVTGSMSGCINGLKANIREFFKTLVEGDGEHAPITDWRAKVIGYRDETCDYSWYEDHGFTTDVGAFNSHIAACRATGGGDTPESLLDAVWRISKETTFREDASRAIVAFTDAPSLVRMSYGSAAGKGCDEVAQAVKDAGIVLHVVSSDSERYAYYNGLFSSSLVKKVNDLAGGTNSTYKYVGSLSTTSLNADMLSGLAKTVSSGVKETKVVEPMLSCTTRGYGTLSFDWKNDAIDGTNNTFVFECASVTNIANEAGSGWQHVELELKEGWHLFQWTYGKRDYRGLVSDCGVVANLTWEPYATKLNIQPATLPADYTGLALQPHDVTVTNFEGIATNYCIAVSNREEQVSAEGVVTNVIVTYGGKFRIDCNSCWKVVEADDWLKPFSVAGEGDGELVVEIGENTNYVQRTGFITVRAGEYGLPSDEIIEKTVKVVQDPHPYIPDDDVHVLTVGVKPRWPWNEAVDIDFEVVLPENNDPVKVYFTGWNREGGSALETYESLSAAQLCEMKSGVSGIGVQGLQGAVETSTKYKSMPAAYVECPSSGVYRVTWSMASDWNAKYSEVWKKQGFHTPAFSVIAKAESAGHKSDERVSDPIRVDVRLPALSDLEPASSYVGGHVMTGTEMVGHPSGLVDPVSYDTTLMPSNGWNCLDDVVMCLPSAFSNRYDRACVINNAYVEGGTLSETQTIWRADKVHIVRDNVFVPKGRVLVIEANAVVKFCYNTKIFIYDDTTMDAGTIERHNIIIKGAYLSLPNDTKYGGDALYCSGLPSVATDKDGLQGKGMIFSQDVDHNKGEEVNADSSKNTYKAISKVSLQVKMLNPDVPSVTQQATEKTKNIYYTHRQVWGDLPRPNEDGYKFFGWYSDTSYIKKELTPESYVQNAKDKMIKGTDLITWTESKRTDILDGLMCPTNWTAECLVPKIDASSGRIILDSDGRPVVYNGEEQTPTVKFVYVKESLIDMNNYDVVYGSGNFQDAGTYSVSVDFKVDYTGSPTNFFVIEPRSIEGGEIRFSDPTNGVMYLPGLKKPTVTVRLPEYRGSAIDDATATKDAKITNVESVDPADHVWPEVGDYRVVASYEDNPNYTGGALTNVFTVSVNPDYVFTEYDSLEEAVSHAGDDKYAGRTPRIIRFSGRARDLLLNSWKDLIRGNTRLNDFVSENFVCWADTTAGAPSIGVRSLADDQRDIVTADGVMTVAELLKFFEDALVAPELPTDASEAVLTLSRSALAYDGTVRRPSVTVTLGGETIASGNYELVWSGDGVERGSYTVYAHFNGVDYVGETTAVSYEVVPGALKAISLEPESAVYDGTMHKPSVDTHGIACAVDYGTGDFSAVGDYPITATASGNYTGTVTKVFRVVAKEVDAAVIELDAVAAEVKKSKSGAAVDVCPHILSVGDGTRTYVEGVDYDLSYSPSEKFTEPGTYTITATFKGDYSGSVSVEFVVTEAKEVAVVIVGDEEAVVEEDADHNITVKPSEGKKDVVVDIPTDVDASKVTVEVTTEVETVKAKKGANVVVRSKGKDPKTGKGYDYDITEHLDIPKPDVDGVVDLTKATVKEEIVKEIFDKEEGAEIELDAKEPSIKTAKTKPGLLYTFREGTSLEGFRTKAPDDTKIGDGTSWSPTIHVKGGKSAFYMIGVEK